jgi:hypothetical protein
MTAWLRTLQIHEIVLYGLVFGLPIVAIGFSFVESIIKALIKHGERLGGVALTKEGEIVCHWLCQCCGRP